MEVKNLYPSFSLVGKILYRWVYPGKALTSLIDAKWRILAFTPIEVVLQGIEYHDVLFFSLCRLNMVGVYPKQR